MFFVALSESPESQIGVVQKQVQRLDPCASVWSRLFCLTVFVQFLKVEVETALSHMVVNAFALCVCSFVTVVGLLVEVKLTDLFCVVPFRLEHNCNHAAQLFQNRQGTRTHRWTEGPGYQVHGSLV